MVSIIGEQRRSNYGHWWILNMHYKESAVFSDVSAVIHCWSLVSVTKYRANVSFGQRFSSVAGVNLYLHMNRAALHALSRARRCRSNKLSATRMVPGAPRPPRFSIRFGIMYNNYSMSGSIGWTIWPVVTTRVACSRSPTRHWFYVLELVAKESEL